MILNLHYDTRESRWVVEGHPSTTYVTDFMVAESIMHPETRRSLAEPGEDLDSIGISMLVEDGVDCLKVQMFDGTGPVFDLVIEVEHA